MPPYPPYGKRMLRDNHWYRMLTRPNVDLVTDPIERIARDGVVTKDGAFWPADVLVLATGFDAQRMLAPMLIEGRNGETIRDRCGDDNPRAYLGITVPGFPNLFMIYGPGTNLAHGGSVVIVPDRCDIARLIQWIAFCEGAYQGLFNRACLIEEFQRLIGGGAGKIERTFQVSRIGQLMFVTDTR